MRLSELIGRELINLSNGEKIGQLARADLCIDEQTGKILNLILPGDQSLFSFGKKNQEQSVSWESIMKIGTDMILIDFQKEIK